MRLLDIANEEPPTDQSTTNLRPTFPEQRCTSNLDLAFLYNLDEVLHYFYKMLDISYISQVAGMFGIESDGEEETVTCGIYAPGGTVRYLCSENMHASSTVVCI